MPWSKRDFPDSMKNLAEDVKDKAVEIANALKDEGYEDSRAIPIAIDRAEEWAKNRGKQIKKAVNKRR